ncbi:transcriptional repressor LexA [Lyngbya confervoides]|uniref:LexA repressor n=1 Tax=Lyngbya confervoides BDU141951 TaxID=1574623 RepID=A0ABD4T7J7_9CYAN|nr:transcriptional repressor LexA [Lyngbya confervoides]MCM1984726.1 transcriptional repressor LexA [Lyngbya confervoides BDU141951]
MEPLTKVQQELYDWLVDYIQTYQHAPSIRQMMQAMKLRSPAPVQSRLEHLRRKGYIDWDPGQARTLRILHLEDLGQNQAQVPILGEIAAGGLIEPFVDDPATLDLQRCLAAPDCFALRVNGDSMIEDHIAEGDIVIMRPVLDAKRVKNGSIVAAHVSGQGTTLKRFFRKGASVTLEAANLNYAPIKIPAAQVEVQGILVGVWRDCF